MRKLRLVPTIISSVLLMLSSCGTPNTSLPPSATSATSAPTDLAVSPATATPADITTLLPQAQRIAATVIWGVVAAGDYLFWADTRNSRPDLASIYGYDLRSKTEFLISDAPSAKSRLASDGTLLVWADHPDGSYQERILSYDLRTRQTTTLVEVPAGQDFSGIAIANGVLYYNPPIQGHSSLYARTLATGQEQLISPSGRDPVIADGRLLWNETTSSGGIPNTITWSLHLRQIDGGADTIVAQGTNGYTFSGYALSDAYVVWAFYNAPDISVYTISSGVHTTIATQTNWAFQPIISGSQVVWAALRPDSQDPAPWSLHLSNQRDNRSTILLNQSPNQIQTWAITSQAQLVFSTDARGAHNIYILPLE